MLGLLKNAVKTLNANDLNRLSDFDAVSMDDESVEAFAGELALA